MKKLSFLILIILISILFVSCSNELSRGEAEDKIEEFFEYPNVELTNFPGVTSSQKLNKEFQNLRSRNFITEQRKGRYGNEFWVMMTEKGKGFVHSGEASYNGYKVASSILELNKVTGIRLDDGKNTAVVDYNLKRTNVTLFGNAKEYYDGDLLDKQITFQLYDDGWRITSKKPEKIVKEKNIVGFDKNFIKKAEQKIKQYKLEAENQGDGYEHIGVINDPDGYTNVREGKSSSSKIVDKVYKGEKFEIYDTSGNWWSIYTYKNSKNGYIHKSKVTIVE